MSEKLRSTAADFFRARIFTLMSYITLISLEWAQIDPYYLLERKEKIMLDLSERLPTAEEAAAAEQVLSALAQARGKDGAITILEDNGVELTPALAEMMVELLSIVARGEMVTLVPTGALLSTQKAADILNVSRPHFSKLLIDGVVPYTKVGSHRRVRFEDLMDFKTKRDGQREEGLRVLQELGQEMDAT